MIAFRGSKEFCRVVGAEAGFEVKTQTAMSEPTLVATMATGI
jgi:hypothetical protein